MPQQLQQQQLNQQQAEHGMQQNNDHQHHQHVQPPVENKTLILSDSMVGNIKNKDLNKHVNIHTDAAVIKKYPGQTAEEILDYTDSQLRKTKATQLIIIAGSNDVSEDHRKGILDAEDISAKILNIARKAPKYGVQRIVVSGLFVRKTNTVITNCIKEVNRLLEKKCADEGFIYMNQPDIVVGHLWRDNLHLNNYGLTILKMNILQNFLSFNYDNCTFKSEYEEAL